MPLRKRILQEANDIGNSMYMLTCKAEAGDIKLLKVIFLLLLKDMIRYKNWAEIPWKSIHVFIYDLQRKIYYHAGKNENWFNPTLLT